MAELTVKELAETVNVPIDRLIKQMQDAGIAHRNGDEEVTDDERKKLLAHLQRSHGADSGAPKEITLKRKSRSVVKTGGGRGGRSVTVEVKAKRRYVRPEAPKPEATAVASTAVEDAEPVAAEDTLVELVEAPVVDTSALEAAAKQQVEEATTAAEAAQAEALATAEAAKLAEQESAAAAEKAAAEAAKAAEADREVAAAAATPPPVARPVRKRPQSQTEIEMARIRAQEADRQEGEGERKAQDLAREEKSKRREEERRLEVEQKIAREKAAKTAATAKPKEAAPADPGAATAQAQAKAQAEERGGKRGKGKERERKRDGGGGGFGERKGRRELSLKGDRRGRRRSHAPAMTVEQQGGEFTPTEFIAREVEVGDMITVGELSQRMAVKAGEVIKTLMGLGVMATINQPVDQDTALLVIEEMGHKPKIVKDDAIEHALVESLTLEGGEEVSRAPVVTVMGHVDHGKTSLLDYIRHTRVTSHEAGGITQHIGAYSVETSGGRVAFIDTPGHAAFTAMRARGARATDIVILVVAADDGVMPQTEEAIQHAKAAGVPIIVAINKMDLEGADAERVTNELAAKDVVPEAWGGDTQFIPVSAITGDGVDKLLEAIVLQAEILELKAIEAAPGRGVVIESRLDKGRGPVATVLVQNGTLKKGDVIIAGEFHGRVRAMVDEHGDQPESVGPSTPVEILGLNGTPMAGDDFSVVTDERSARDLAEFRRDKSTEKRQAMQQATKLENMFASMSEGEKRVMKLVIKADVRGSLEAITQALAEIGNDEVAANVLGAGVGGITETDVSMAQTYGAAVFGFNVRADNAAKKAIEREGLDLRYYSVIYELIDDVKAVLTGMLSPEVREEIVGTAEVRDVFRSPRYGQVAGCMVIEGSVHRNKPIRVLRDNVVIYQGELESLRRFKDDVNEVRSGTECGIGVRNYNDVRPGDKIEVYDAKEVARTLE